MGWLEGRVALVTGGASGIGLGVVERYRLEGAQVGVLDASAEALKELGAELPDVVTVHGDVRSPADNRRAVAAVAAAFGHLDVFVGVAGVFDYFASVATTPPEDLSRAFDELFAVNVKGYLLGVQAALPHLLNATSPAVILTLSNAAFLPAGGGAMYTASKHAVLGLVRQLAYELAPKVRVNGVAPGGTLTGLRGTAALGQDTLALTEVPQFDELVRSTNPLQLAQRPQDHAGSYVLLASESDAVAITGTVINSDGGLQVRGLAQAAGGTHL